MSWTTCRRGHVHWGRRGAAGLLLAENGAVLLQLRAAWTHQGGTWSIPGGARENNETAVQAALREAHEELRLSPESVDVLGDHRFDCGGWSYRTVLARPLRALELRDTHESDEHRWVALEDVDDLPLHPGFARSWREESGQLKAFVAGEEPRNSG